VRDRCRGSVPDLLNWEEFTKKRNRPPTADKEEREWVRDIWDRWFDELFPPENNQNPDDDE